MAFMTREDFEARYRQDRDPWQYTSSRYEHDKYRATLAACLEGASGPVGAALELGSSIGVFSALLAPHCRTLVTIDASPTAVAAARHRLRGRPVETIVGAIPQDVPRRPYELVVASEILYYLTPAELDDTLELLRDCTAPGARLVAVHWRPPGPERPFDAAEVHTRLRAAPWLAVIRTGGTAEYLLDVLERR